jgi:hypothetical protein
MNIPLSLERFWKIESGNLSSKQIVTSFISYNGMIFVGLDQ